MSSWLVRQSSFIHTLSDTLTHMPCRGLLCWNDNNWITSVISVILVCVASSLSTVWLKKEIVAASTWNAEYRGTEVSHFSLSDHCSGHNTNGSVLTSVIDLRDLCSLANLHQALGAIMTFTQTDYNFKWLFKKNPWWCAQRRAVVRRQRESGRKE